MWTRLFSISTVRYAFVYVVLFAVSVTSVLGIVYWKSVGVITDQIDETIRTEIASLAEHYQKRGLSELAQVVAERSAGRLGQRGIYLLANADYQPVAGNLDAWPAVAKSEPGWVDFYVGMPSDQSGRPQVARARTFVLAGGFRLLVGRDMTERTEFRRLMVEALFWALGLSTGLALVGGVVMSRDLLRRIDAINRSSRAILAGDLRRRMPVRGNDDEFDQLAGNLNGMLDRIEGLMERMRGVAHDIAHDLRGPISRLRSRLEVTLIRDQDPETYRKVLRETVTETEDILATFNAILNISLAESGALRKDFVEIDLGGLLHDVAELYAPLAEQKGSRIDVATENGLIIQGHPNLMSQAVANLLDNAIKYAAEAGPITLSAGHVGTTLELAVADRGSGIPAERRDEALQRFARLDASRSTGGSGARPVAGLGGRPFARRHPRAFRQRSRPQGHPALVLIPSCGDTNPFQTARGGFRLGADVAAMRCHRKTAATRAESRPLPPFRSPTRRVAEAISMGPYHRSFL